MNENIKYLIDEAITALENRNPDATWHFLRRAKAFADAEQPVQEPPPECKTEAEKTAFAFGWWKAMESKLREKNGGN